MGHERLGYLPQEMLDEDKEKQYTNIFLKRKYSGRKRLKNCLLLRENLE